MLRSGIYITGVNYTQQQNGQAEPIMSECSIVSAFFCLEMLVNSLPIFMDCKQ